MREDIELMGGSLVPPPPTRENPALRLSYLEKNVVEETLNFR